MIIYVYTDIQSKTLGPTTLREVSESHNRPGSPRRIPGDPTALPGRRPGWRQPGRCRKRCQLVEETSRCVSNLSIYIYIFIYIYICICVYIYMYIFMYIYIRIYLCMCSIHIYLYTCMYVHTSHIHE